MGQQNVKQSPRITAADVQGRTDATRLARSDARAAIRVARKIAHPWYRCQALTAIAEARAGSRECVELLGEAIDAAYEQDEPNRIARVGAWPLRVLVALDPLGARSHAERLLATIASEPHGLRRLDGVGGILAAVLSSRELRDLVLPAFARAARASSGWRTERIVSSMAEAVGREDIEAAMSLLRGRSSNRFTSRASAALSRSSSA